jgi:hypothetical protein
MSKPEAVLVICWENSRCSECHTQWCHTMSVNYLSNEEKMEASNIGPQFHLHWVKHAPLRWPEIRTIMVGKCMLYSKRIGQRLQSAATLKDALYVRF